MVELNHPCKTKEHKGCKIDKQKLALQDKDLVESVVCVKKLPRVDFF